MEPSNSQTDTVVRQQSLYRVAEVIVLPVHPHAICRYYPIESFPRVFAPVVEELIRLAPLVTNYLCGFGKILFAQIFLDVLAKIVKNLFQD